MRNTADVAPVGQYTLGRDPIELALGTQAGDFIFLQGLLPPAGAGDHARRSLLREPPALADARHVWHELAGLLDECGSTVEHLVRCDQYFTHWNAVPFFHTIRREQCQVSPPSTSLLVEELAQPGQVMAMDAIAVKGQAATPQAVFPRDLDIPATSGFAPVMQAGNWAFVAGFMAAHGKGDLGGIAPDAKVPAGHLWKGNRIQLESRYLIEHKLKPALEAAGMSLSDAVKATVALSHLDDLPAFNMTWQQAFGERMPATTIIPVSRPGFAIEEARIEINLTACGSPAVHRIMPADAHRHAVAQGWPIAVRAEDFLIFPGLLAADEHGAILPPDSRLGGGYRSCAIDEQMAWLLEALHFYCNSQGASLDNVVRITHLHTDLHDHAASCRAWQRSLPGTPLPISALKVPALPVPGAVVQVEVWVYAP